MSIIDISPMATKALVEEDLQMWVPVCGVNDLYPERGSAALLSSGQIALFRLHTGEIYAIDQYDPYGKANVMSRGLVGTNGNRPTVASPMYKQVFDLETGECLDTMGGDAATLRTWPVSVRGGIVYVQESIITGG